MARCSNFLSKPLFCAALVILFAGISCEHHYYRVYDPYYTDYHMWDHQEDEHYHRWAVETHHDPHRNFRRLPPDEQKQYWTWRHNHGDNDNR